LHGASNLIISFIFLLLKLKENYFTGFPHSEQNFVPKGKKSMHVLHPTLTFVPQDWQNLSSSVTGFLHLEHFLPVALFFALSSLPLIASETPDSAEYFTSSFAL
jgi:hypothetical protein